MSTITLSTGPLNSGTATAHTPNGRTANARTANARTLGRGSQPAVRRRQAHPGPAADHTRTGTRAATTTGTTRRTPTHTGQLRLTRRGRAVVFLGGLLLVLAAAVFLGAGSVATSEAGEPVLTEVHVVTGGQTLWAIAEDISDGDGTAAMVDRIEQMNGLGTANLQVGQQLRVPVVD